MAAAAATEATTSSGPAGDRAAPAPAGAPGARRTPVARLRRAVPSGRSRPDGVVPHRGQHVGEVVRRAPGGTVARRAQRRPFRPGCRASFRRPPAMAGWTAAGPPGPGGRRAARDRPARPAPTGPPRFPARRARRPAAAAAVAAAAGGQPGRTGRARQVRRHNSAVSGRRAGSRDSACPTSDSSGAREAVEVGLPVDDPVEDRLEGARCRTAGGRWPRTPPWRPRNARPTPGRSACPRSPRARGSRACP